jgi:hypothetical protein
MIPAPDQVAERKYSEQELEQTIKNFPRANRILILTKENSREVYIRRDGGVFELISINERDERIMTSLVLTAEDYARALEDGLLEAYRKFKLNSTVQSIVRGTR